jgi:hypothetical protein
MNFGVENIAIKFPSALDFLDDKDFVIAFTACRFLALGDDGSARVGSNETKIITNFLIPLCYY